MDNRQYFEQWPVQPPAPMPPYPSMPPIPPGPPNPPQASKSMSVSAFVCGILGIVGSFLPIIGYFTLVLAILGIVFGARGMKIAKYNHESKGLAIAGLVLGIIGVSFYVLVILLVGFVLSLFLW